MSIQVTAASEPLKELADKLRNRNGIEYNDAKLGLGTGGVRVEFVRGKDFVRYFHQHPELADFVDSGNQKSLDDRIAEVGIKLLKSGLLCRTERKYKRPKPGKPRLVKWPKTLEPVAREEAAVWSESSFYAWQYDRPTSAWLYFWSSLLVVVIIACCLLPIAPFRVKVVVFYTSLTLLSIATTFILVRTSVWLLVWALTGKEFWLFPNALSDEVGLKAAFTPLVSFEDAKGIKSHWLVRAIAVAAIGVSVWFLNEHKPGSQDMKQGFQKAHDDILDFLSLHEPGMEKLGQGSGFEDAASQGSKKTKDAHTEL